MFVVCCVDFAETFSNLWPRCQEGVNMHLGPYPNGERFLTLIQCFHLIWRGLIIWVNPVAILGGARGLLQRLVGARRDVIGIS